MAPSTPLPLPETQTTATICPDDSIPCLLRTILNNNMTSVLLQDILAANTQFNWDPLSFGVTVVIGVLAFLVSLTIVFQGLLAANSGRIKAGYVAIGLFAKRSRTHFNIEEFRLRTTCYVPFIDIGAMLRSDLVIGKEAKDQLTNDDKGRSIKSYYHPLKSVWENCRKQSFVRKSSSTDDLNATWMKLLARLDLGSDQSWPLIKRDTDYLPPDLSAAPAAAKSKDLALLAVIAEDVSIVSWTSDRKYPIVDGPLSRLTFHDHPYLGPVGLYELLRGRQHLGGGVVHYDEAQYDMDRLSKSISNLVCQNLKTVLGLALGDMFFDGRIFRLHGSGPGSLAEIAAKLQSMCLFHPFFEKAVSYVDKRDMELNIREKRELMLFFSDMPAIIRGFPITHFELYDVVTKLLEYLRNSKHSTWTVREIAESLRQKIETVVGDVSEKGNLEICEDHDQYYGSSENFVYTTWMRSTGKRGYRYNTETFERACQTISATTQWLEEIVENGPLAISNYERVGCRGDHQFVKDALLKVDKYLYARRQEATFCALWIISRLRREREAYRRQLEGLQLHSFEELTGMPKTGEDLSWWSFEMVLFCRALLFAGHFFSQRS